MKTTAGNQASQREGCGVPFSVNAVNFSAHGLRPFFTMIRCKMFYQAYDQVTHHMALGFSPEADDEWSSSIRLFAKIRPAADKQ